MKGSEALGGPEKVVGEGCGASRGQGSPALSPPLDFVHVVFSFVRLFLVVSL